MNLFQSWQFAVPQLVPAIGLSVALGFLAWGLRAVTAGAALTGIILTSVLCLATGPAALIPVLTVFVLTFITTRIGRRKKERLGTSERRHGRGALQILANVGVAAICAAPLIFVSHGRHILLAAATASLAEAAGDTVSSELGQTFGRSPRMITNWRRVSPGNDGAITLVGTLCSLFAIIIVCNVSEWANLLLPQFYWTAVTAAFVGTLVDSLLGATLERPGRLGNNGVNFTSTACSAALAIAILMIQRWS